MSHVFWCVMSLVSGMKMECSALLYAAPRSMSLMCLVLVYDTKWCVVCLYRLLWHAKPRAVEVHPCDGSVICSVGHSGHHYVHYWFNDDSRQVSVCCTCLVVSYAILLRIISNTMDQSLPLKSVYSSVSCLFTCHLILSSDGGLQYNRFLSWLL